MTTAEVLMYAEKPARVSRLAVVSLAAAVVGAVIFFLVVPTLLALVLGIVAGWRIRRNPLRLGGVGFANAAVTTSLCAFCLTLVALVAMPSIGRGGLSNRSYCAANLHGIVESMIVYSNENNDQYPVVTYALYSAALNSPMAGAMEATADDAMKSYYKTPFPQAGSVTASLWMLVLRNQCSPKQFLCKSVPTPTTRGLLQNAVGENFYDNFQNGTQISYSAAYPWKADGTVGKWWMNTTDASLPLMADMAPENGTGTPPADLLSPTASVHARNSVNHQRDGQNIAFADAHTEFDKRPDVGQGDDNIWTTSGRPSTGPAAFGGEAAGRFSPMLTRDAPPFDVVMYPIRNVATGGM